MLVAAAFILTSLSCTSRENDSEEITVFAAASLNDVIEALSDSFQVESGHHIRLNIAASSILARQIERGAHADVFVSASPDWVRFLVDKGIGVEGRRLAVTSRLVLVSRAKPNGDLPKWQWLQRVRRLAIGDPAHVPAGLYARRWLECAGLWDVIQNQIVPTLDVRAALVSVVSGAADAAIVYASDVLATGGRESIVITDLEDGCQPDIEYYVLAIPGATSSATGLDFVDYLSAPARRGVWEAFGFTWRR